MAGVDISNLFDPGYGGQPPYLAGRNSELGELESGARPLYSGGAARGRDAFIYGPRGNGKTALLNRFLGDLREAEDVHAIKLTPDQTPNEPALCRALQEALDPADRRGLVGRIRKLEANFSLMGAGAGAGVEVAPAPSGLVPDILREAARARPLILAIDEAHTLDLGLGRHLLNTFQNLRGDGYPVLLIMAGTPGLKQRLSDTKASFWDRGLKMAVNRLDDASVRDALVQPLRGAGVTFARGAVGPIVEECNGYPFFVQLYGRALTRELIKTDARCVTPSHVEGATRKVEQLEREEYYNGRWEELKRHGVLDAAEALARGPYCDPATESCRLYEVEASLEKAGLKNVQDAIDVMVDLGYVWNTGRGQYEAGIPSLMRYVRREAKSRDRAQAPRTRE